MKWLYDIQNAILEIYSYLEDVPEDYKTYSTNIILKRAIERDLEIIGEAVNRILKEDPKFPLDNAKKIISLTRFIHLKFSNE